MTSLLSYAALLSSFVGLTTPDATADLITPKSIVYAYDREENAEAKLCEIILGVESPTSPELVEFTAFASYGKSDDSTAVGFIAMAAEQVSPDEFALVEISEATFASQAFRSAEDMDYEVHKDGAVMSATLDAATAGDFLRAFVGGDFVLTLAIAEAEGTKLSYRISEGPEADIQEGFAMCLEQLIPRTVPACDSTPKTVSRHFIGRSCPSDDAETAPMARIKFCQQADRSAR